MSTAHIYTHSTTQQERLHRPVLVLNSSFEPSTYAPRGVAVGAGAEGSRRSRNTRAARCIPHGRRSRCRSVIRLLEYRRIPHQTEAVIAQEYSDARPLHLPVLYEDNELRRSDAGSCVMPNRSKARPRGRISSPAAIPAITAREAGRRRKPGCAWRARRVLSACIPAGI